MMRKLFVALLVGAVAVGLAAPAFAADLKYSGTFRIRAQADKALPCFDATPGTECDGHLVDMRHRSVFSVETEGGVRGVLHLEIGDLQFGTTATGGSVDVPAGGGTVTTGRSSAGGLEADSVNVETKSAYIDFPVPATPLRLRAGVQPFATSKSIVMDTDATGLSLYGKLREIDTNFWWIRANDSIDAGPNGEAARDLYGLDLAFSPMKDLSLNAYFIYDHDMETPTPTGAATGFFFGAAGAGKVQNIRWDLDFIYGTKETDTAGVDRKGWVLDGGVGMALAGTPWDLEVRGWYATGDERNGGDNEAFPVIAGQDHEPGTQVIGGGGAIDIDEPATNPQNTWGLGLIARWTVSPRLRVTPSIFYVGTVEEGTAAEGSPVGDASGDGTDGLVGVDSVGTEIAVRADYTIARGLVFTFVAGHVFLGDDEGRTTGGTVVRFDDVTKVAGALFYGF